MDAMQHIATLTRTRAVLERVTMKLSPSHWSHKELTREIDKLTAAIDAARGGK